MAQEAASLFRRMRDLHGQEDARRLAWSMMLLAWAQEDGGDVDAALIACEEAEQMYRALPDPGRDDGLAEVLSTRGRLLGALGRDHDAVIAEREAAVRFLWQRFFRVCLTYEKRNATCFAVDSSTWQILRLNASAGARSFGEVVPCPVRCSESWGRRA